MFAKIKEIIKSRKASTTNTVIGIIVALFIAATLLPEALKALYEWTPGASVPDPVVAVVQVLLPVLAVIGIAMIFFRRVRA